jgi:hypothetical protein
MERLWASALVLGSAQVLGGDIKTTLGDMGSYLTATAGALGGGSDRAAGRKGRPTDSFQRDSLPLVFQTEPKGGARACNEGLHGLGAWRWVLLSVAGSPVCVRSQSARMRQLGVARLISGRSESSLEHKQRGKRSRWDRISLTKLLA